MLGQSHGASAHHLGAERHRVDHQDLVDQEALRVLPFHHAVFLQRVGEVDGAVSLAVGMDVVIVCDEQIDALGVALLQFVQVGGQIGAERVIAVHDPEIFPCSGL